MRACGVCGARESPVTGSMEDRISQMDELSDVFRGRYDDVAFLDDSNRVVAMGVRTGRPLVCPIPSPALREKYAAIVAMEV
jgi:hypothetical protein